MTQPRTQRSPQPETLRREIYCMIHVEGKEYCIDPASGLLGVMGKQWTLALVGVLGNREGSRFSEIEDAVSGIGSKVLTQRLKDLTRLGLVERRARPKFPAHVEYRLTDRGVRLRGAIIPLLDWAVEPPPRTEPVPAAPRGRAH